MKNVDIVKAITCMEMVHVNDHFPLQGTSGEMVQQVTWFLYQLTAER